MHRNPFKTVGEICSTRKLELVHSDICGIVVECQWILLGEESIS